MKCKALEALVAEFDLMSAPQSLQTIRGHLLDVIEQADRIGTARAQASSVTAGRLLSELEEQEAVPALEWPSQTPDELAPPGYWPYELTDHVGWEELFMDQTQGERDEERERLAGPPPWRRGEWGHQPEDDAP
jgi:hypothetical protein